MAAEFSLRGTGAGALGGGRVSNVVFFGVLLEVSVGHFASFHPLRPVFHGSSQVFFGEASAIERVKALRTSICEQERLRAFA